MGSDAGEHDAPRERWHFGDFTVDRHARSILRRNEPVPVEPQVFDVLVHLLRNRGRVVGKLELLDTIWGDRFVAPATLTSRIRDLRAALDDSGRDQRVIKTAHGRGFQFVADTTEDAPRGSEAHARRNHLVGRATELATASEALESEQLVTLVGPGGIGKTHLLRHLMSDRPGILIELAEVTDDAAAARAVLAAVGGAERADLSPLDALVDVLQPRTVTLAIDNCEHLIEAVRALVRAILASCPTVQIIATSRRPLALEAERVVRVDALTDEEAADLLVLHARRNGVEIDQRDPSVAAICRRVDGLPLALKLAASKARAIPLAQLLELLDANAAILTADTVDAPDHHRSLQSAIRWSVDLLTPSQQRLFARLSVFPGSFTLAGALAVGEVDELDDLIELRDVSLVDFEPVSARYVMLEPVKAFGAAMDRADGAADAHTRRTLAVIEAAATAPASSLLAYLTTVDEHWADIRAVVRRAIDAGDTSTLHRVVAATTRYGDQTFSFELLEWAETAIQLDLDAETRSPDATLVGAALLQAHAGQFEAGFARLARLADPQSELADLARLWLSYFTGDLEAADAAVAATQTHPVEPLGYERAVGSIGGAFLDIGAGREIDATVRATLAQMTTYDDDALSAGCRLCDALRLDWSADADLAIEELTEVELIARHLGLSFLRAGASTARSIVLATSPDGDASARGLRATMRSYLETSSWQFAMADLGAVALTLARNGQERDAAELLAVRALGGYRGDASNELAEEAAGLIAETLTNDEIADARTRASRREIRSAVTFAIDALSELVEGR